MPRRTHRILGAACVAGLALVSAACGSSGAGAAATKNVVVDTFMFQPKTLHLDAGDTVTWTNHDDIVHTVTSGTRDYAAGDSGRVVATHKDGAFDLTLNGKGATASKTFTTPGTYHYFCDRHPGMEADIDVS